MLVWDTDSGHVGRRVRDLGVPLPVQVPWRNRIEPKRLHGERAIVQPGRKLTAAELEQRVHDPYHCEPHELLTQQAA